MAAAAGTPGRSSTARGVDAVLESLRRGQRQLTRNPRAAIDAAVKQLLSVGPGKAIGWTRHRSSATYRVDDLARAAGTTVRNVRAYQERGLLHPPARMGRTAIFDDTHLSRLRMITSMLDRGYTTAHIHEMVNAWEHGKDLGDVLGLEHALLRPQPDDQPTTMSLAAARDLAGGPAELDKFIAAGLAERRGGRIRVLRPNLMTAFSEMREYGMDNDTLITLHLDIVPAVDKISGLLVTAGAIHLAPRFVTDTPPTSADVDDLVAMLTRFRTLGMTAVAATLAASIETTIEGVLTDYLAHYVRATKTADAS